MKNTIKSNGEVDRIFRSGKRIGNYLFSVRVANTREHDQLGRVAFIAGKRTGNAVARNRSKRMMREVARHFGAPWNGYDIIFVANERTGRANITDLDRACAKVLKSMEIEA